jgi:hypothetical protein
LGAVLHAAFTSVAHGESVDTEKPLLLVTASDCHLCEHAQAVLAELGIGVREVLLGSADADALAARGIPLMFLPVLTDGERVIAYGRLSKRRLQKDLAA